MSNNIPSGHLEDNSITKWSLLNGHRHRVLLEQKSKWGVTVRMGAKGNILINNFPIISWGLDIFKSYSVLVSVCVWLFILLKCKITLIQCYLRIEREQSWKVSEPHPKREGIWESFIIPVAKYRLDLSNFYSLLFIDNIWVIKEAFRRRSGNEFYRGSDTCAIANYKEQINLLFPSLAEYPTYFSHWDHSR